MAGHDYQGQKRGGNAIIIRENTVKKFILILTAILTLSACGHGGKTPQTAKSIPTYRIGYMICNSRQETLERFLPMSAWLGKKLGVKFKTVAIDTIQFTREIKNLDFTHSNSLLYVTLHRFNGVEVLAAERKGVNDYRSQGIIFTRADSGIKTLADLKGRRMIFGPMLAPTGFMSQIDLLQRNGIDPEDDLAFYTIPTGSDKHEKVVYGVMFGKFDAGAIPLNDLEEMAADNRIVRDDYRIIAKAAPIPYCNFAVTQKIDSGLARRFKEAVLSLGAKDTVKYDGETVRVAKRAWVKGYRDIKDSEFDVVREMAKRTNMPPYQKF